jgi:hypothetical protein
MDCAPGHEDEFNEWYNEEHFPERAQCPGFIGGRRFETFAGSPKYHTIYEYETLDVLKSSAYLALAKSSPWSIRVRPYQIAPRRNIYREITNPETRRPRAPGRAGAVVFLQIDSDFRYEDEFNARYDTSYGTALAACPGFIDFRRFYCVEGSPRYLAISEFDSPEAVETEAYLKLEDDTPWSTENRRVPPGRDRQMLRTLCREITPPLKPFTGRRAFAD